MESAQTEMKMIDRVIDGVRNPLRTNLTPKTLSGFQGRCAACALLTGLFFTCGTAVFASSVAAAPATAATAAGQRVTANYGKIPLSFEANKGQTDPSVQFVSRGSGYSLFLTQGEVVLNLKGQQSIAAAPGQKSEPAPIDTLRMKLVAANADAAVTGADPQPGVVSYFVGNDPTKWYTGIPTFGKVSYAQVYPGVDLVFYGNQRQLEYDFVVAADADPSRIRLDFSGGRLSLGRDGNLKVSAKNGWIDFRRPTVYQEIEGKRQTIPSSYALLGSGAVGFTLGDYDRSRPLVIDPVLEYSTYLGGGGINAIAVDSAGYVYVAGSTGGSLPVTKGAYQTSYDGAANNVSNAFIAKLNQTGTGLVYATYLGGSGSTYGGDSAYGIAVDASGNAYLTGSTYSTDFPVTAGAYQSSNGASSTESNNAFVTELNPAGTKLLYSTYLGGSGGGAVGTVADYGSAIAVDKSGYAYVTGTAFGGFPTTPGAFQTGNNESIYQSWYYTGNAFVSKLNQTGSALVYSTFLGGSGRIIDNFGCGDGGSAIAVDGSGYDAYVTGGTCSANFPTKSAFQSAIKGSGSAFVTKFNETGTALVYSTFLGGSGGDAGSGIAIDGTGHAYVTGATTSKNFPVTSGAFQSTLKGSENAFVTKLNPAGNGLTYSTYLGGSISDTGRGIAVDSSGYAYLTGNTSSANFPVTAGSAFQTTYKGKGWSAFSNIFVSKMNQTGTVLVFSSYLGGSGANEGDSSYGIAVSGAGGAYVAGITGSTDFPVTSGAFETKNSSVASFIAKFDLSMTSPPAATTTSLKASVNPQVVENKVTFEAIVKLAKGAGTPTGKVVFRVDGKSAATVALGSDGSASWSTSSLTVGQHAILASYQGNLTEAASSKSVTETITRSPSHVVLTGGPIDLNGMLTLTATISGNSAGSPTGSVIFSTAKATLYTTSVDAKVAIMYGNPATAAYGLGVGKDLVTAAYSGDAMYLPSSGTEEVVVTPETTADFYETYVSAPPAAVVAGVSFKVTDTVQNIGVAAAKSVTHYFISSATTYGPQYQLSGSRAVPALAANATSTGTATLTVPSGVPSDSYYLGACANDTLTVPENKNNLWNNCNGPQAPFTVSGPDLEETAVSGPAAVKIGGSFQVTDTAKNIGKVAAGASVTRYYLSPTTSKTTKSHLLTGSRAVPKLAVNATSSGTVTVSVPSAVPHGSYYLLACANDNGAVAETDTENNCKASSKTAEASAAEE